MKNVKILFIVLLSVVLFTGCGNNDKKLDDVSTSKVEDDNTTKENVVIEEVNTKYDLIDDNTSDVSTDAEFVNYLESVDSEVDSIVQKKTISENDEKSLKNTFVTITDFIFYDGEIKGKKFNDLTTAAKEKVISIYEKIDSKIESRFPNYKENIKIKSKDVYNNLKGKLSSVKEKIQNEYREYVGDENYQQTVDDYEYGKNNMKEVYDIYKPYIESGKEKASEYASKAKDKISSWYNEYKESQ